MDVESKLRMKAMELLVGAERAPFIAWLHVSADARTVHAMSNRHNNGIWEIVFVFDEEGELQGASEWVFEAESPSGHLRPITYVDKEK